MINKPGEFFGSINSGGETIEMKRVRFTRRQR